MTKLTLIVVFTKCEYIAKFGNEDSKVVPTSTSYNLDLIWQRKLDGSGQNLSVRLLKWPVEGLSILTDYEVIVAFGFDLMYIIILQEVKNLNFGNMS